MVAVLITVLVSFLVSSLFGYVVHRSLHQSWSGFLNKKHMTHHLVLYPPSDYLSDVYRSAGRDNTVLIFALAAVPLVLAPIVLWLVGILPLVLAITTVVVMGVMGFLHDYLHDAFHIRNHLMTRIPIVRSMFARWNKLHYLHHVRMKTNYGIFLFYLDHLFGTFWRGQ